MNILRLLIAFLIVTAAIGSIIFSIHFNDIQIFIEAMGGIVFCLFLSYFLGVWDQ